MKSLKTLLTILIIAIISFGTYKFFNKNQNPETPVIEEAGLVLPAKWSFSNDSSETEIKVEKESDKSIKPGIVLIKSELPENSTPAQHVDNLINGARATLASLKFSQNIENTENDYYLRLLKGRYYSKNQQINLSQRVYVVDSQLYTLTASYHSTEENLEPELEQIFDLLFESEIISN